MEVAVVQLSTILVIVHPIADCKITVCREGIQRRIAMQNYIEDAKTQQTNTCENQRFQFAHARSVPKLTSTRHVLP